MTTSALLGGLTEAVFLIAVTRAAFAITDGSSRVGVVAGWYVSIDRLFLLGIVLILIRVLLAAVSAWLAARLTASVVASFRRRLIRGFLSATWPAQQAQAKGSLQQLVSGHSYQASSMMTSLTGGLLALANLVAMLGISIAVDPVGAAFMAVAVGLLGLVLRPIRTTVRRRSQENVRANMALATATGEMSGLGLELNVFHVGRQAQERIDGLISTSRQHAQRLQFVNLFSTTIYTGMAYAALIAALWFVNASDSSSLTSLGAVILVMLRSLSYGQRLQSAVLGISSSSPAIEELTGQLDEFNRAARIDHGEHIGEIGRLEATSIGYRYPSGDLALQDISFAVEPREVIGVVGPSGSGKSTLVQLLLRLREPTSGTIRAAGRDIASLDRGEWARKVTFVPQSPQLFTGTVADNIRIYRDEVTQADVERAATLAHVHDEIRELSDGYDHRIGDQGSTLSGGQQQRISIARALVERPDVLILDEPTSSLDTRSENLIRETLAQLASTMTIIIIAHRMSTLDICDRIMVIQGGRLIGFGSPSDVQKSNDFYREALRSSGTGSDRADDTRPAGPS